MNLPLAVEFERADAFGGEGDAAFGADRFGGQGGQAAGGGALEGTADAGRAIVEVKVSPVQAEKFALAQPRSEREIEQRLQPVALERREEPAGLGGGERFEAAGAGCSGLDVAGDVARQFVLADGMLQCGLEDGVHVRDGERGQPLPTALADRAAALLLVEAACAALAAGAELVEPGADVPGSELGDLLAAEAGYDVEADAGVIAGVGGLPEPVDDDAAQPVRQVGTKGAVGSGDGSALVAGGDAFGELVGGFLAGGAVDADALAGAVGGEDVVEAASQRPSLRW